MKNRRRFGFLFIILSFLIFFALFGRFIYINTKVNDLKNKVMKDTYLDKYDISLVDYEQLDKKIDEIASSILDNEIILSVNNKKMKFSLKELGVEINNNTIKNMIIENEENYDYYDNYMKLSRGSTEKTEYDYKYVLNEDSIREFLNNLKNETSILPQKGSLVMGDDHILRYENEIVGFTLDVEKSLDAIKDSFNDKDYENEIILLGDYIYEEDTYKSINTKISSFTTKFKTDVDRKYNLETATKLINGSIVFPGDIFSYYEKAGPYNRKGYVYYNGIIGNGVCQVATTLYDSVLLSGLKVLERYSHPDMPKYVDGGLDTSVATTKTFNSDFKFKNTSNYPIYVSAFINNDELTVEIWSNENMTDGITYKLRSEKISYGYYNAYREHYKDGVKVYDEFLGSSWYYTEVNYLY